MECHDYSPMKTIILSLGFFIGTLSVQADISSINMERIKDKEGYIRYQASWYVGGDNKTLELTSVEQISYYDQIVNQPVFNNDRTLLRFWIYFNGDGSISLVNMQLANPFQSNNFLDKHLDATVRQKIQSLKAYLDTQ